MPDRCVAVCEKANSFSTVSKILRQRDKYMNPPPKEENTSPGKKSKAKLPDFEKTLTNWVRNQQKRGSSITDHDLRKQAKKFSFSRSDQEVVSSTDWLEKFKRKNRLFSQASDPESILVDSSTTSLTQTPLDGSPTSSDELMSPSMSPIEEQLEESGVKMESHQDFFDFGDDQPIFDDPVSDDDGDKRPSPASPRMSRPLRNPLGQTSPDDSPDTRNRQRSQTYPHAPSIASGSRPSSSGQNRPSLPVRSAASTSSAPIVGDNGPTAIDPRQTMKRHKSVPDIHYPEQVRFSSMQPPPLPRSADTSPVNQSASPTEDENIRALHAIKTLLEQNPGVAEPDDYLAIGKLMQKMKLLRPNPTTLPGGMYPMDIADSPRISKKRTIMGIST
jgi:hypothetical protein